MFDCDWINFDSDLTEDLIKKIYAKSLYDPQFLADVLTEYKKYGRDKVWFVYKIWVNLYEWSRDQELKPIARELAKKIDAEYERKVKEWNTQKQRFLQNRSDEELLQMLKEKRF